MSDEKSEAALEALLRRLDEGGRFENIKEAIELSIARKGQKAPELRSRMLEITEAMALYLSEGYHGKISKAARKILANGPELTQRARELFLRMAKELREAERK
jgi:hypothetical protein